MKSSLLSAYVAESPVIKQYGLLISWNFSLSSVLGCDSRLSIFERKNWRVSYNCLIVLEHLLTHGPESVAEEFENDKEVIYQTSNFQYIDEKGSVI